jgi:hypothetical protein
LHDLTLFNFSQSPFVETEQKSYMADRGEKEFFHHDRCLEDLIFIIFSINVTFFQIFTKVK